MFEFMTYGVCSKKISFDIVDGKVRNVKFVSGCDGNLKGISRLVEGMTPEDVVERLRDVKCGQKQTSCPAQLAAAIAQQLQELAG